MSSTGSVSTGRSASPTKAASPGRASGTRQRILDIARELFARQGFTGTSIADIAGELGTTTAALYYHFRSKADILNALLAEPMVAYTRIIETLESGSPSAEELLGAFIDLTVGVFDPAPVPRAQAWSACWILAATLAMMWFLLFR